MQDPLLPAFQTLAAKIKRAERILLCAHQKPDGDTLGSSSSVLSWLLREEKSVHAFCTSPIPEEFRYLDRVHRYTNDPAVFRHPYDLIIVFDSGDLRYCGIDEHVSAMEPNPFMVNIDHHPTNTRYADLNCVDTSSSSTSEIISRFYKAAGVRIDDRMATSLLTGLMTDTGNFSNGATTSASLLAASRMLAAGGRMRDIQRHVNERHTIGTLGLWGNALRRLRSDPHRDIAITYIRAEDTRGLPEDSASGISNFLNATLGEHETLIVLHETADGYVRGSIRSMKRDISKLAKLLGGGGHARAAGFKIKGRIEETPTGPRVVSAGPQTAP